MSAIRVMAPCMAMGEAAGRAAKIAIRNNILPSKIEVSELQQELINKGAYLNSIELVK